MAGTKETVIILTMTLTRKEFQSIWQQIPDMPMWRNKETGVTIVIAGSTDKGWYTVRKTTPISLSKSGGFGLAATENISPYYLLPTKPVGMVGTQSRMQVRENEDWRMGTFNDALNAALNYMYNYNRVK